jgi:thioredoxin 1
VARRERIVPRKAYGDFGVAKVAKVDVDENQELAVRYGISSIPALLFFKDGEVVQQLAGVQPKALLAEKLGALLPAA